MRWWSWQRPFSLEEAAAIYRCLLLDLVENLGSFKEADLFVAFTPVDAGALFQQMVPAGFVCFPQQPGDLGERMHSVFGELFHSGYDHVAIIGSDLPALPDCFLRKTFLALRSPETDIVLGPSRDGGYYLIGASRPIPELFKNILWGSDTVLLETIETCSDLGLKPYFLPPLYDIDTVEDLRHLKARLDQFPANSNKRVHRFLRSSYTTIKLTGLSE